MTHIRLTGKTIKEWVPRGASQLPNVNTHTRLDQESGHLSFFTYDLSLSYLTYYELNKEGDLIKRLDIEKSSSTARCLG
jgi:carotenoid cleavage dioxygenase-like enzyme